MSGAPPSSEPEIRPFGDSALLAVLGDRMDVELNARVHELAGSIRRVRQHGDRRWGTPVAGYCSLLVPYDLEQVTYGEAHDGLLGLIRSLGDATRLFAPSPVVEIPVRYGGADGPDLEGVAERLALTSAQLVELHTANAYRVFLLGFVPGFAYLGPLPRELVLPRRATPRQRVPRGSVAIAGEQTGVYPLETPGGWHLLGRTDAVLWDVHRQPPALLQPGALVRFVAVG